MNTSKSTYLYILLIIISQAATSQNEALVNDYPLVSKQQSRLRNQKNAEIKSGYVLGYL